MGQAFLEDQLVEFEFRDDLLQPHILFLKSAKFRQLRLPHPAKPLVPVVVSGITNTHATTGRLHVTASRQLHLNLTQQLEYVLIRITFPSHHITLQSLKIVAQF